MRDLRLAMVVLAFGCRIAPSAPQFLKVEPPNWWPDQSLNHVRLLIHGIGLRGASVTAPNGLSVSNIRENETGTCLFADLSIAAGLTPGDYPLTLNTAEGSASVPFSLKAPLPRAGRFQGFGPRRHHLSDHARSFRKWRSFK